MTAQHRIASRSVHLKTPFSWSSWRKFQNKCNAAKYLVTEPYPEEVRDLILAQLDQRWKLEVANEEARARRRLEQWIEIKGLPLATVEEVEQNWNNLFPCPAAQTILLGPEHFAIRFETTEAVSTLLRFDRVEIGGQVVRVLSRALRLSRWDILSSSRKN